MGPMNEVCNPPHMAPAASHKWISVDGADTCSRCGVTFLEHTRGVSVAICGFTTKSKRTRTLDSLSG